MKCLYLHIGTPKTATSSIQKFLEVNGDVLAQRGYAYPPLLRQFPHVHSRRNGHFLIARFVGEDNKRDRKAEHACFLEGLAQVEDYFQTCDHVILSDESIWFASSYVHKNFFRELWDYAKQKNWQVKIIVYVRRQDEFLESRWNQFVKQNTAAAAAMTFEQYLSYSEKKEQKMLHYGEKLDHIASVFGAENLMVRRFDRADWVDGSIVHDFLHQIGIDDLTGFEELEESANLRIGRNETEIKRILNKNEDLTPKELSQFGMTLRRISGSAQATSMLPQAKRQQLLDTFAEENEHVADAYIGDRKPLFCEQASDLPQWTSQNEEMLETVITFFTSEIVALKRENEQLHAETRRLYQELRLENKGLRQEIQLEKKQWKQQDRDLEKLEKQFRQFRDKVKHPFRTLWQKLFHRF